MINPTQIYARKWNWPNVVSQIYYLKQFISSKMGGGVVILANSLIDHFQWGLRQLIALLNWPWFFIFGYLHLSEQISKEKYERDTAGKSASVIVQCWVSNLKEFSFLSGQCWVEQILHFNSIFMPPHSQRIWRRRTQVCPNGNLLWAPSR